MGKKVKLKKTRGHEVGKEMTEIGDVVNVLSQLGKWFPGEKSIP